MKPTKKSNHVMQFMCQDGTIKMFLCYCNNKKRNHIAVIKDQKPETIKNK